MQATLDEKEIYMLLIYIKLGAKRFKRRGRADACNDT